MFLTIFAVEEESIRVLSGEGPSMTSLTLGSIPSEAIAEMPRAIIASERGSRGVQINPKTK